MILIIVNILRLRSFIVYICVDGEYLPLLILLQYITLQNAPI
jgi:hypothetical protein